MQRLNRGMMDRYEIPDRVPGRVNAVQFGAGERLLGVADRLIDDAGIGAGIACVLTDAAGPGARLSEQDGMYTVLVRGYRDERDVRREQVVQAILRCLDPDAGFDALTALAGEPALALGLLDMEAGDAPVALGLAARLLAARWRAERGGLEFICLGEDAGCAERARGAIAAVAAPWGLGDGFSDWLNGANAFYPALADALVFRADAREAAQLCAAMNYADAMIHIAEPYVRWTIQAPEEFRKRWPLDGAEGVRFVDDLAPELALKHRLFDAGLFAMVAPGWLLGCDTLGDCMKHEALRRFIGNAYFRELMPADREAAAPYVIRAFERFENPLNRNGLLAAGRPLLRRFVRGALPLMRAWADERFEPPRRLSFALAATIMLYAGARPNADGVYEVVRGKQTQPLADDAEALAVFATLSHDMPPETLAYAVLADRDLWRGADLRQIDGLEQRVALDIANLQRDPAYLPGEDAEE